MADPTVSTNSDSDRRFEAFFRLKLDALAVGLTVDQLALVRRACLLAWRAHDGQLRASGQPYIEHPAAVALILHDLDMDYEAIAAGILHDVVEDTDIDLAAIKDDYGPVIAHLVDGVTKMDAIDKYLNVSVEAAKRAVESEGLRKLLLAMIEDVRVVLIKLADRLHNMRTLKYLGADKQKRVARETSAVYAPLAGRLGVWKIKWELEDLAFRYLEPGLYRSIAKRLDERRAEREARISGIVARLSREMADYGIRAEVAGRPKHIYSIWRKMQRKDVNFDQLYDVQAVRVFVKDVATCYAALGVVHTLWSHIPNEFDDYITNPKSNHYRSLHTAVIGPAGKTLEVQIRTVEMHEHAERGVAAHWQYKEGVRRDAAMEAKIDWLRQVLEWKDDAGGVGGFLDRFNTEVLHERIYVITPQGKVVDLPKGATAIDFAFQIHTDVGYRCRGAKADGSIVPLNRPLRTAQQVEILTTRQANPSRDWLNPNLGFVKTAKARGRIRQWFKQLDHDKNVTAGKEIYERELKRMGVSAPDTGALVKRFNFVGFDDLLAAVGHGDVTAGQIATSLQAQLPPEEPALVFRTRKGAAEAAGGDIRVHGVGNLLTQFARCCKPVPNDAVVGYITRGRGVSIHRRDCPNILGMRESERARLIEVGWTSDPVAAYPANVRVLAYDRQGLLRDITMLLASEQINVVNLASNSDAKSGIATVRLTLEVQDLVQMSRVLDRLLQVPNIYDASRCS